MYKRNLLISNPAQIFFISHMDYPFKSIHCTVQLNNDENTYTKLNELLHLRHKYIR